MALKIGKLYVVGRTQRNWVDICCDDGHIPGGEPFVLLEELGPGRWKVLKLDGIVTAFGGAAERFLFSAHEGT